MIRMFGTTVEKHDNMDVYSIIAQNLNMNQIEIPLAIKVDNEVFDLRYIPRDGDEIIPLYIDSEDGFRAYRQTIMFVFSVATKRLYPDLRIVLRRSINKATYCEIINGVIPEEDFADKIAEEMNKIISEDLYIEKKILNSKQASEVYWEKGEIEYAEDVGKLGNDKFYFYSIDKNQIYMRGQLAYGTSFINKFELKNFEHGLMLSYPTFKTRGEMPNPVESRRLIRAIDEYRIWGDIVGIHTVADLNRAILDGKTNDLVHMQEGFQEKKIAEFAQTIKAEFPRKRLVLIAGPSSSGKTTFASRLNIHLRINGLSPINISLDDYYKRREELKVEEDGSVDFETVEAIDYRLFNRDLKALIDGEMVTLPKFDFMAGEPVKGKTLKLRAEEVIIVEGIHALNEKLSFSIRESEKFKIYITPLIDLQFDDANPVSPTDLRLVRRIVRDMQFRNMGADGTLQMWDSVQRGELSYIFPFEEQADVVFNSSMIYDFSVLKQFAWDALAQIGKDSAKYSEAIRLLDVLSHFVNMDYTTIPTYSIMKEFIGGSSF